MAAVAGRGPAPEDEGISVPEEARRSDGATVPEAARERKTGALAEGCGAGERAALARAISVVEDRRPGFRELLARVAAHGRRGHRTGITGPPGAGKSTLAAALARHWRGAGEEVAIVAVDPTSPYSGGALLGDRVRMAPLQLDRGVFIRSMATRGARGGLAEAVYDVIDLMEGSGFGRILLETVGVGQTELGVAEAADTVVVVLTPESGDDVQAMKAGLAEVADVFVVNKADRPGAGALVRRLRDAVGLGRRRGGGGRGAAGGGDETRGRTPSSPATAATADDGAGALAEEAGAPRWKPPVLAAVATAGEGIGAVADAIEDHRRGLAGSGALEARRIVRAEARIRAEVRAALEAHVGRVAAGGGLTEAARMVAGGRETVYEAAQRLLVGGGILSGDPLNRGILVVDPPDLEP